MILALLIAVAFVGMWICVLALLSQMSGWGKLAAVYRAQHAPSGSRFPIQGAWIGDVLFTACLTIYTSQEGLYLSVWPIFRFREPPLFIPWSALHNPREKRWLLARLVEFDVGSPSVGKIRLLPGVLRDAPHV